jgi:xylitol oxidase
LPRDLLGAAGARAECHPLPGHAAENCTPQLGRAGPWHERLPHFRLEFTPSSGAELQTEYFAPRHLAPAIIRAMATLRAAIAPHVYVSEIRTIAADDLWLSPSFEQPQVALHFTWKPDWPAVQALLPQIERALAPFGVRPHWGKLCTMAPAALRAGYRRWHDFRRLRDRFDPGRKFTNAHLDALLGP